mmetsp:Transcript_22432/g.73663  ORF Transcript_22432/g.73663 Transcript_22432/m.73663 type:complete len:294 (+) Transcript_22432:1291-2172(+)
MKIGQLFTVLVNVIGVDAKSFCKLLHISQTLSRVGCCLPSCSSSPTTSIPNLHKFVHALVVLLKDLSVVHFLLRHRGVDRVEFISSSEFFIRNLAITPALQFCNPSHTDPFALHGFGPPEHLRRHSSFKGSTKCMLLSRPFLSNGFEAGIDIHDRLDDIGAQERYTSFKSMSHCHSICSLAVDVMKMMEYPPQLPMERSRIRGIPEVQIASEKLIRTFSSENHFDILRSHASQEIIGNGRSDKLRLIGLEVIDNLFNMFESLICIEKVLMMSGSQEFRHHPGSSDVRGPLHTY